MEPVHTVEPKRRSQASKVGKHKYEMQRMNRIEAKLDRIEHMQRIIFHGLGDYFQFDRPLVEEVGCHSEQDLAVITAIFETGDMGILAKEIVPKLPQFKLEKHKILRIVNRVNKNIQDAFGQRLIEKRGKKWNFTRFGIKIWGKTREDAEDGETGISAEQEEDVVPENWTH